MISATADSIVSFLYCIRWAKICDKIEESFAIMNDELWMYPSAKCKQDI